MSGDSVVATQALFQTQSGSSILTSPHQFDVQIIKAKLACTLNSKWHSRLPLIGWSNVVRNTHSICFAAYFEGEWYAVGIWSSPVAQNRLKDGKKILELRRLAISHAAPRNTASWMLKIMRKQIKKSFPDIIKLISYQDTEVHRGTIYKADNWIPAQESSYMSWTTNKRKRTAEQSKAPKIRWEYTL